MIDQAFAATIVIPTAGCFAGGGVPKGTTARMLLGLVTVGDGRGGWFYWDANSILVVDNDSVFAVTGQTVGRWLRLNQG